MRSHLLRIDIWHSVVGLVGFLTIWELAARSGAVPAALFPPIADLAPAFGGLVTQKETWIAVALTVGRAVVGLLIAFCIAVLAAIAAAAWRPLYRALEMLSDMAQTLPPPALVPLLIFAVGLGSPMFLTVAVFAAVWPLYAATATGLATTEPMQLAVAKTCGLSAFEAMFRVRLMAALPRIFTGLHVAMTFSLMATVASEMIAGSSGLGYQLFDYAFSLQAPQMYAVLLIMGLAGAFLATIVSLLHRTLVSWHLGQMKRAES